MCLGISIKDLNKFSAHSLQVWACVLLGKADKSPNYICKQLCWLGDSFCMYLHDTRAIQDTHCKALQASMQEILNLLAAQLANITQNALLSKGTIDANTGKYKDDTD